VYSAWSAWAVSISASTQTIAASGGSSTITTSASRSRTWTWNGVGTTHTDTETATPTLSGSAGGFTLSGKTVTASNNTTTNSRSITITATSNSVSKSITITQSAGAKVYGNWSAWTVNISNSGNVAASGGSSNITTSASRTRTWTWNGVSGSGGTETGTGTPTLSKISGAGSFASNKVTYDNNTSTSARSTVIRATMDSVTKDTTVTQNAGSKTYSSWGAWSISLSANVTTIAAAGGNATLFTSATRSRTWQWNGTGTTYTENASGAPTLSKVNGAASLSGSTVNYGNNTSTSSRSSVFRATIDSITKDITISQSAGAKVYGNWSGWTVTISASPMNIAASGGSSTITCSAVRTRNYTWNGVGTTYTETENDSPTLSKSGDGTLSGTTSGSKLTYGNRTTTTGRSTTVTATYNGVSKSIDITQSAGVKTNIPSNTKVLFLYDGASDYAEAINNSVYINNARDNDENYNGVVKYNIRFKVIITESYKWNNVGNVISSESYGSIDHHKDISFNASTVLYKDTDNSYYGSFFIVSKNTADEEEYSAQYITNNNIIITLYVRRPRLYWQIYCNQILEQSDQPFTVNVNNVTRTKLYNNNTVTEGCAGNGEQYLYLFSTSNMMTTRSITVKLIRNNNPNDACKLTDFTDIDTHTKTSVGLEEDKTAIRTFVTSYIQTLPINLCNVTFKYAELNFRVFIAKGTGN